MTPPGLAIGATGLPSRREEIVDIARRIFAERGYNATSMRDIAEAAGLMAGSLYSHFRSKSEILRLVLEPLIDALEPLQESALTSGGPGMARFERMVTTVLTVLVEHRDETTIVHYDWSDLAASPDLADLAERSNHLIELWEAVVVDGQDDGSIRRDIRPEVVVRAVASTLLACVDTKRYVAQPLPGADELADELTALFRAGIGAAPGGSRRRAPAASATVARRRGPR
jgi:AcrR family transcriptional regulator